MNAICIIAESWASWLIHVIVAIFFRGCPNCWSVGWIDTFGEWQLCPMCEGDGLTMNDEPRLRRKPKPTTVPQSTQEAYCPHRHVCHPRSRKMKIKKRPSGGAVLVKSGKSPILLGVLNDRKPFRDANRGIRRPILAHAADFFHNRA